MYVRLLLGLLCVLGSAHFADASPFAYFGNYSGSGRVSAIDLNTNNISHIALPGAQAPYGVAVNSLGSRVYVTDKTNANVFVVDTATNAVSTFPVTNKPGGLAVNTAGTRVYLANTENGTVTMLNATDGSELAIVGAQNAPDGVAVKTVSPTEDRVYVTNKGSHSVSIYSAVGTGMTKIKDLDLATELGAGFSPAGIALNPTMNRAYVANNGSDTVTIIDTTDNTVVKHLAVGSFPFGIAVSPNGLKAYVTLSGSSDTVAVIDTSTNELIGSEALSVGRMPQGIASTLDGTKLVVVNYQGPSLSVVTLPGTIATVGLTGDNPQAFGKFIGPEFVSVTLNSDSFGSVTPKDLISVNPTTKKILVPKGSTVELNVTPIANFKPDTVTVDGLPLTSPYTLTNVTTDKVVNATFTREKYKITVSKSGSGTVTDSTAAINCGNTCSADYYLGTEVIFSAEAAPGYLFASWQGSGCQQYFCSITTNDGGIFGEYTVTAVFQQYTQFQKLYTYAPSNSTLNTAVSYTTDPANSFLANSGKNLFIKPAWPSTTLNLPTGTTSGAFTIAGRNDKITILGGTGVGAFIIQ